MIDVHTHILPSVDDGASSIDETFKMLHEACIAGFTDIFTTSHYIEQKYEFNKFDRKCIIDALQEKLNKEEVNLKLHNGAEIYISNELPNLVEEEIVPTLAGSMYVLFELPLDAKAIYTEDVIDRLIGLGKIPVIAHPERYRIVQENPNIAIEWVEQGALLQSNYASIVGRYRGNAKETLLKLLDANAIHFLGTDTHRSGSFYTRMDEFLKEFRKRIGSAKLKELSEKNPKYILSNIELEVSIPKKIKLNRFFK